jgi:Fe2+ transport system protein FeoA
LRTAVEVVVSGSWSGNEVQRLGHHVSRAQDEVLTELLSALGAVAQAELRVTVTAPGGIKTDNLKVAIENARAVGVRIEVR